MEFEVSKPALAAALGLACRVVPAKPSIPIMECLLIKAHEDEGLVVAATDLSLSAKISVAGAVVREPGAVALRAIFPASYHVVDASYGARQHVGFPRATLQAYFDAQDGDWVEARLDGSDLITRCGRTKTTFRIAPATDYPLIPEVDPDVAPAFEIRAAEFLRLVTCAGHAVATDGSRPALGAVCLTVDPAAGEVSACSSDGFRFARARTEELNCRTPGGLQVLLPPDLLDLTSQIPEDEILSVSVAHGHVYVQAPGVFLSTVPLGGEYPDLATLPAAYAKVRAGVIVQTRVLSRALRGVGSFADSQAGRVVGVRVSQDGLAVSAGGSDHFAAGAASVVVPGEARMEDDEADVAVDVSLNFLRDALRAVPAGDHVCLEVRSSPGGTSVLFVTDPTAGDRCEAAIAPIRPKHPGAVAMAA